MSRLFMMGYIMGDLLDFRVKELSLQAVPWRFVSNKRGTQLQAARMFHPHERSRRFVLTLCISVAIPPNSALLSPPREKGRPVFN